MSDIVTEHDGHIRTIQLNRPAKKNAMTSSMYIAMADALHDAAKDDQTRVVLWHGAGHSFTAGNDLEDFMKNPPEPGDSPQAPTDQRSDRLREAAGRGGTGCRDRGRNHHAGALRLRVRGREREVPAALRQSRSRPGVRQQLPASAAFRVCPRGLVTQVVPDQTLLVTATETARKLAEKPTGALRACKRLMRQTSREQLEQAVKFENEEFAVRVRSAEAKQAFSAFFEKHAPAYDR